MHKLVSFFGAALLFATAHAWAADAPVYAVLSLIGDKLDIAVYQPMTDGKPVDNQHVPFVTANTVFDDTAVAATIKSMRELMPAAALVRLDSGSPALYEKQLAIFAPKAPAVALPEAVNSALKQQKAAYLILITKIRDEAGIRVRNTNKSSGTLEGLGFFVDRNSAVAQADPNLGRVTKILRGYLAPFMYVKVSLIDVAASRVIRDKIIAASYILPAPAAVTATGAWEALSSEEKVQTIQGMIEGEIPRAMPELLGVNKKK
jgi:hypothetical protein